jgi:nucleotide-binding universal stress UspA family protein
MSQPLVAATLWTMDGHGAVVVGTDGSPSASVAVRYAAGLAAERGHVLHVVASYGGGPAFRAVAEHVLADAERKLADTGVPTELHAVPERPSVALCQVAEREHAVLIVVGNRGIGSMFAKLQRPLCERVARRARCHVCVVDTRAQWRAPDEGARIAVSHAEPMAVRIDHAATGPRVYLAGLRLHHGLVGQLIALDGLIRRGRLGVVEVILGAVLVGDDWHDFPFALRDY